MKKVIFKNKLFYIFLICFISILLLYNLFVFKKTNNLGVLIPIVIEIVLLFLISTNHRYAKIGIYLWTTICLIIGFGFEAIADLMDGISKDNLNSIIYNTIGLFAGILIIHYTRITVLVE